MSNAMEAEPLETFELENGLTVYLYDRSRKVAGDRVLVKLDAEVDVEIQPELFPDNAGISYETAREALGERVRYTYDQARNFIDASEKDAVLRQLREHFIESNLHYMSKPDFPLKLILRKVRQTRTFTPSWLKV